ncbi:EamA/RhaT family transporter [Cryobacterium breve]|uniref:EamA/RhaT family transporter n=1 Tax=Cryobacterium breve TaxID=1259258 RepID=A0ABY2IXW8_9MICO|nr:EamA/RhaT family transporter [Cryobacterium sp. TmT3-12]TFC97354.1 EamA/RhaT family transporter [Cryobacterium breve]
MVTPPTRADERPAGVIPILLAGLLWGTTGTAAHFLPPDVSPLATGAATIAGGGVLLWMLSARRARRVVRDRSVRFWLLGGVTGIVVYPLSFYSSMHLAGVAVGTVVSLGSAPVFAAGIELLAERRGATRHWALCTLAALTGTALLVAGRASDPTASEVPVGVLLGLLAGLSYALYTHASHRVIAAGHSSRATVGALFGVGAVCLAPVLAATGAPLLQSAGSLGITAYLVIGPMFVAYLLFSQGLRTVRGSTATSITLVEPLVATVLAIVVVGERLPPSGWAGLALVLLAVTALVRAPRPK